MRRELRREYRGWQIVAKRVLNEGAYAYEHRGAFGATATKEGREPISCGPFRGPGAMYQAMERAKALVDALESACEQGPSDGAASRSQTFGNDSGGRPNARR